MTERPPDPYSVPPGAPSDPDRQAWSPNPAPPPPPYSSSPPWAYQVSPPPPAMPPLGPPYLAPEGRPPDPRYPQQPPEQWPQQPPLMAPPPLGGRPARPGGSTEPPDRSRWIVIGAIVVVIAVLIGVLVSETRSDAPTAAAPRPRSSNSTSSSSREGTTTTTSPDDLESVVLDIERFVERERGLEFKQDVTVKLAGEGEFQDLLLRDFDEERAALTEQGDVLIALGLLPTDSDVVAQMRSLLEIGVVGFYDPKTKQLVVRGTDTTPYVREVLAHELTHALDDQWFGLDRPQLDNADDETGYGFLGLVEGNARRVEDAYLASLPLDEQQQAFLEQSELVAQHPELYDLPQILITLIQSPYEDGPPFISALLRQGQNRLDSAFASPPTTSEQILHPERYLSGQGALPVPVPVADGAQTNTGVLGELMMREILFDSIGSASQVDRAVDGWGGDQYVTWVDPFGRHCLRDTVVGDTIGDTRELVQSLQEWALDHDATVDAPDGAPATFTVCT